MCQTGIFHGLHAILCKIETLTTILWKLGNMCTLTQFDPQILISDVYDGKIKY